MQFCMALFSFICFCMVVIWFYVCLYYSIWLKQSTSQSVLFQLCVFLENFMAFFPACHGLHWIDKIVNSRCVFLLLSLLLVVVIIIMVVIIYCYCLNQSTQRQAQKLSVTQTHILLYYIVLCIEQGNHRIYKYIHHIVIYIYIHIF